MTEDKKLPLDGLGSWEEVTEYRTGDDWQDVERGTFFAELAIVRTRHEETPESLALLLADIVKGGEVGALEAGFLTRIATVARKAGLS